MTAVDLDAERALLGALLLSPTAVAQVDGMASTDLTRKEHRAIFEAVYALEARGERADVVTVTGFLRTSGEPVPPLLVRDLAADCPTPEAAPQYAETVRSLAKRRRVVSTLSDALGAAQRADTDLAQIADEATAVLAEAGDTSEAIAIGPLVDQALNTMERRATGVDETLIQTGFVGLDRLMGGMVRGQSILVAARPGVGKSAMVANVARNVAGRGLPVAFFSLEMSRFEVGLRMLCTEAGVSFHSIRSGAARIGEWEALLHAVERLADLPLIVDDRSALRIADIRASARRLPNVGLIVVDYLQLMGGTSARENRREEIEDVSRGLKLLAKALDVPVLACAQLNRDPERRQDKRPQLSDLRATGQLEQDADVVILLHRDDANPVDAEAIVAKHRNGPTDTVLLSFERAFTRFDDRR